MNRIFPLIFIALATALSLLPTGCSSDAARPAASDSTLIVDHISRLSIEEPRRALALIITSDGRPPPPLIPLPSLWFASAPAFPPLLPLDSVGDRAGEAGVVALTIINGERWHRVPLFLYLCQIWPRARCCCRPRFSFSSNHYKSKDEVFSAYCSGCDGRHDVLGVQQRRHRAAAGSSPMKARAIEQVINLEVLPRKGQVS